MLAHSETLAVAFRDRIWGIPIIYWGERGLCGLHPSGDSNLGKKTD